MSTPMYGAQNDPNQLDGTCGVNINSFGGQLVCFDDTNQNIPVATNIPLPVYFAAQEASHSIEDCSVWVGMPNSSPIPASETFSYSSPPYSPQPSFIDPGPPASAYASLPANTQLQLEPINNTLLDGLGIFSGTNFRLSKQQFEGEAAPVFQTSAFRNSHYNPAHYNNPNFQPEQWTPDCYEETKDSIKARRKGRENLDIKDGTSPCTHATEIRNFEDNPGQGEREMDVDENCELGRIPMAGS